MIRLKHSNYRLKIRARAPPRALRLTSLREPRPRRRPGPRPRLRTSSTRTSSWIRRDSTRSAQKCPRFFASPAQLSWKSSRLTEPSPELCSCISPAPETSRLSETSAALTSLSTRENFPSLPLRRRPRTRPPLLPKPIRRSETSYNGWIRSSL